PKRRLISGNRLRNRVMSTPMSAAGIGTMAATPDRLALRVTNALHSWRMTFNWATWYAKSPATGRAGTGPVATIDEPAGSTWWRTSWWLGSSIGISLLSQLAPADAGASPGTRSRLCATA